MGKECKEIEHKENYEGYSINTVKFAKGIVNKALFTVATFFKEVNSH